METEENYCNVLGVSPQSTKRERRDSYRKLAKMHHPDKNTDDDAGDLFKLISEAYQQLGSKDEATQITPNGES